jgi:uncharacterized protein YjlB
MFVLQGAVTLQCAGRSAEPLSEGDCFVIPAGLQHALAECSPDLQLLEARLPGQYCSQTSSEWSSAHPAPCLSRP